MYPEPSGKLVDDWDSIYKHSVCTRWWWKLGTSRCQTDHVYRLWYNYGSQSHPKLTFCNWVFSQSVNIKSMVAFIWGEWRLRNVKMLKRHLHTSKGWGTVVWIRASHPRTWVSLGLLLRCRFGLGSRFCISDKPQGDAGVAGWRTTLWEAGLTGEHWWVSRTHQTWCNLTSVQLSSSGSQP